MSDPVRAIGPHQLNKISTRTSRCAPPDATTVLSLATADGRTATRPAGACGAPELALLKGDRLVYAPLGPAGAVFLVPFVDEIPNG
jgi:hypothetical protein